MNTYIYQILLSLICINATFSHASLDLKLENTSYVLSHNEILDLAETFFKLDHHEEAIKCYQRTIDAGASKEEKWYAEYQTANAYLKLGQWNDALKWYNEAFFTDPGRAEPLEKMTTYYRLNGRPDIAYAFAKQGKEIPYPGNEAFFVEPATYDYRFDEEISLTAYYVSNREEGLEAANRLIFNRKTPKGVKENTQRNIIFYVDKLLNTNFIPLNFQLPMVREDLGLPYKATNPSIIKTDDGYSVICRTIAYTQKGGLLFKPIDPSITDWHANMRTRNFLLKYTKDLTLISQTEIIDSLSEKLRPFTKVRYSGIEDCRIFSIDPIGFTGTVLTTTAETPIKIGLCFAANNPDNTVNVETLIPLKVERQQWVEKNWLPFVLNETLYIVYFYDPFAIYEVDQETGATKKVVKYTPKCDFSQFRGSAGPISFDDGYLIVVHEVISKETNTYLHRFLYLDQDFQIQKISNPFTYRHQGVEFCCGMTIDHSGENLLMGIGIEDAEAFIAITDLSTVRDMLKPINQYY